MKPSFKVALAASLLATAATTALSATTARADMTLNGAVGLPLNPTAQIPLPGGVRVQADYFDLGRTNGISGGLPATFSSKFYGLHAAGRVGARIEINGGVESLRNKLTVGGTTAASRNDTGVALGAKYLFTRESDPAGVRIAAGVGYSDALVKNLHAYVVGTKYFGVVTGERVPITGHLGLRYDRFKANGAVVGTVARSNQASIYLGAEVPLIRTGIVTLVGEVQSKNADGGATPYSASLRFRPRNQPFSASLGIQRQGALFDDSRLFAQIGYSFDTKRDTP